MTRCKQCNATILDNTTICPLCRCVVEPGEEQDVIYPDVWLAERKLKKICNFSLMGVLLASGVLLICNYALASDHWWSIIPVASMAYAWLVFRLVLVSSKGYRLKVLIPILFAVLLVLIIDAEMGFYRWSLNFVLPGGILLVDLIILILMITNRKDWHSYIIMQIGMLATCVIPLGLWFFGIITSPLLSIITFGVSLFLFIGTLVLGERTARTELKRRFHIR